LVDWRLRRHLLNQSPKLAEPLQLNFHARQ
jgi:hypothetical protein